MKRVLVLFIFFPLLGCAPSPKVDLLAPDQARIGDVIDVRDSAFMSLGTEGWVYFGPVKATGILKWTPSDIYVEVPPGISGKVTVKVQVGNQKTGGIGFLVVDEASFPRVMSFGDSITYWGSGFIGTKMEEDPYMRQFNALHINHGRRGEKLTGAETLDRWRYALEFSDAQFAILMHGANDLSDTLDPEDEIPLEEMQQSLIRLVDAIASTGTTLILCTLPPRVDPCGDVDSPTTEEYNDWVRAYADEHGIPLVDVYQDFMATPGWEPVYFGANCLHPITEGYMRIAELVNEKIVELFLPTCTDLDGDGYGDPAAPACPQVERDCDDSDPDIHPGIIEASYGDPICSDGLDNDCDGLTDEEDDGCQGCDVPEDCDDGDVCTDDDCVEHTCVHSYNTRSCDDGDPCTMDDVCSDGACLGDPLDADGDTYVSDACEGNDCDDSNPDIHPGVIETPYGDPICSDGLDNDCDGDVDLADSGCQACVGPEDCEDGNACTDDVCDPLAGCLNACNASGPEDPCCQDPACSGSPQC